MVLPEAPAHRRAACRLLGIAGLVALFAAAVLSTPAQAHHRSLDVLQQTEPWDEPDPPEPDASDDDDPGADADEQDDPVDGLPAPIEHGATGSPDDPVDTGGPAAVDALAGAPTLDVPELLQFQLPPVTSTFVGGTVARMRTDGKAAIPRGAPKRVRTLLSQINSIIGKRYKWGGGHTKLVDKGYDCSGAVSYGLIKTGLLKYSIVSGRLARWGEAGEGRWVTIYANKRHVYMEVAGLRLDTNPVGDAAARKGVRWRPVIGKRDGFKVRHPAGL